MEKEVDIFKDLNFDIARFSETAITWLITSGLKIILILIALAILIRLAGIFSRKIFTVVHKSQDNTEFKKL
jgi:hypothetical protein